MELSLQLKNTSLVDQVEDSLFAYFKNSNLTIGDAIPNENTLAEELGVARSVLRECLSRLKMMGMIHSRPRKGMVMAEPTILGGMKRVIDPRFLSEQTIIELLEFRISLEIGISSNIFEKITPEDIKELDEIVRIGEAFENNEYAVSSEFSFHAKLYDITGNKTIAEFQDVIHPILTYIKKRFRTELREINMKLHEQGLTASHADLLQCIKNGDKNAYRDAIERHFEPYRIILREYEKKVADQADSAPLN